MIYSLIHDYLRIEFSSIDCNLWIIFFDWNEFKQDSSFWSEL
jgi:hypothetical protein